MTRTSRARIRPFTRICGCRLGLSPQQQNGSAPRRRIQFIATQASAFTDTKALLLRRGCDSPQRSARIKVREPKRSCRQQFRAGKVNLVTIQCRSLRRLFGWRVAKVRFMRCVRSSIVQHRIDCCSQRLKSHDARKNSSVADLGIDYERRSLRHL